MDAIRNGLAIPIAQTMNRTNLQRSGGGPAHLGSDVILSRYMDLDEFGDDDDSSSAISSTAASTAAPTPSSSTLSSDDEGDDDDDQISSDCESAAPPL